MPVPTVPSEWACAGPNLDVSEILLIQAEDFDQLFPGPRTQHGCC